MNEIEKMYSNAGIVKRVGCLSECFHETCSVDREHFEKLDLVYPPFTAEKQIAILKLLANQCDLIISHFREWEFIHFDGQEPTQVTGEDFAETFAKLINAYWQSLTSEEKQQIKEILK